MSKSRNATGVRESSVRLSHWLQPLLTTISGKPHAGQRPLFTWSPLAKAASGLVTLAAGLIAGYSSVSDGAISWPGLLLSWVVTTHAMRFLNIGVQHHASHGQVAKRPMAGFTRIQANRLIGEAVSLLLLAPNEVEYRREHATRHHSPSLATYEDPDAAFVFGEVGFQPGRSLAWYWWKLASTLLSPLFYARRVRARLESNFRGTTGWRHVASWSWLALFTGSAATFDLWLEHSLVLLVPQFVLFSASDLLQRVTEHRWLVTTSDPQERLAASTVARFLGDAYPPAGWLRSPAGWLQFGRFWLGLPFHILTRTVVLMADLPQHDLHHWRVTSDWANAAYAREAALAREGTREGLRSDERWGGLVAQLNATFRELSELPRNQR